MEYTVKALAELSGVTARTLRWYDQKGLLKPLRVSDAGYRIYGPEQVDRLHSFPFPESFRQDSFDCFLLPQDMLNNLKNKRL